MRFNGLQSWAMANSVHSGGCSTDVVDESSLVGVNTGCFHVSPVTKRGKRLQLLQMLLLPFIPMAALIIQNCLTMNYAIEAQREATTIEHQVNNCFKLDIK